MPMADLLSRRYSIEGPTSIGLLALSGSAADHRRPQRLDARLSDTPADERGRGRARPALARDLARPARRPPSAIAVTSWPTRSVRNSTRAEDEIRAFVRHTLRGTGRRARFRAYAPPRHRDGSVRVAHGRADRRGTSGGSTPRRAASGRSARASADVRAEAASIPTVRFAAPCGRGAFPTTIARRRAAARPPEARRSSATSATRSARSRLPARVHLRGPRALRARAHLRLRQRAARNDAAVRARARPRRHRTAPGEAGRSFARAKTPTTGACSARSKRATSREVDRATTVVILGDGRTNYHDAAPEVLDRIRDRSRALVWLCPEPRGKWADRRQRDGPLRPQVHRRARSPLREGPRERAARTLLSRALSFKARRRRMHRVDATLEPLARPDPVLRVDDDGADAVERLDERQALLGAEDEHRVVDLVGDAARSAPRWSRSATPSPGSRCGDR